VALAYQQIVCGDAQVVVAGGQECMSQAPHLALVRAGHKLGDLQLTDSLLRDGLTDVFYGYPMGMTAENIAQRYNFDREMQDAFALQSQQKAAAACLGGVFNNELATVMIPSGKNSEEPCRDEYIRFEASMASMGKLKPVFRQDGSVTAANASGIND